MSSSYAREELLYKLILVSPVSKTRYIISRFVVQYIRSIQRDVKPVPKIITEPDVANCYEIPTVTIYFHDLVITQ